MTDKRLTHLDEEGNARMVDVGAKRATRREAVARAEVLMEPDTLRLLREGQLVKGDVLTVAQIAGIQAAKRTHELIPMCHPLMLSHIAVDFTLDPARSAVLIEARARVTGPTGVEMEALTAASVAALTIYDMAKAVDRTMRINALRVVSKSGGRSGNWQAD